MYRAGADRNPTAEFADQDQLPAGKAFAQDRISRVPRPRRQHQRPKIGAFLDQRVDPLLR
jgi:hypothetical protein